MEITHVYPQSQHYERPDGTGVVQGDNKPLPDRGVNTGVTDTYGSNLQQGYDNGGSIKSSTQSDKCEKSD